MKIAVRRVIYSTKYPCVSPESLLPITNINRLLSIIVGYCLWRLGFRRVVREYCGGPSYDWHMSRTDRLTITMIIAVTWNLMLHENVTTTKVIFSECLFRDVAYITLPVDHLLQIQTPRTSILPLVISPNTKSHKLFVLVFSLVVNV